jgi:hypothetical protein
VVRGISFERSRLGLLSSISHLAVLEPQADWVMWVKYTTSRECQTKYLGMSPVMDNSERLYMEPGQGFHSNFLN